MKLHTYFFLILVSFAFFAAGDRTVTGQDFPTGLLQAVPQAAAKLNSDDVNIRASILDEMVINEPGNCTQGVRPAFDLSKEDYAFAVGKVLEKDMRLLNDEIAWEGWCHVTYLAVKFEMKQFAAPLAVYLTEGYLDDPRTGIRYKLLETMMLLKAKEQDVMIAPYLKSSWFGFFALQVLTELRSKKAIPALIDKLTDNTGNRSWAIDKLAELGVVEAAPHIAERLWDEDENVRYTAIDALGRLNARAQSKELWQFFRSGTDKRLSGYAIATLIQFEDKEAVTVAIDDLKALVKDPRSSDSIWAFIEMVKPKFLISTLISRNKTKTPFFADAIEEKVFRMYLFQKLVMYKTPLAIPFYRKRLVEWPDGKNYPWKPNNDVASLLFDLNATEALDDLIDLFNRSVKPQAGAEANKGAAELSTILAKFGHRKTWRMLIDYAANTESWSRSRIISELNRQTDKKLWNESHARIPRAMSAAPISVVAEKIRTETGIPITIDYVPRVEQALCTDRDDTGCVEVDGRISVYDVAASIVSGLNKENYGHGEYTFLLDNGNIRILKTDTAIAWWRETMLRKAN